MTPIKEILVATDFGECSKPALERAVDLARRLDAHLTVMHSYEVPSYAYAGSTFSTVDLVVPVQNAAKQCLDQLLEGVRAELPGTVAVLRQGPAWEQILDVAKSAKADLVVLGTHGRRGMSHALLGSVAEKVLRLATMPVLTVHGGAPR